ncbi:MAG: hypothetical protein KDK07_08390 [Bauldia sp.]|nr:hypothetical protein [Bauldia sp.]
MALAALWLATAAPSLAQDAISAPAAKSIGVAKPEMVPSLIVLNAGGASLSGDTLTLKNVAGNAILFADRPVRSAGHALTAHLLDEWDADDSFGKDPPNATVSVFDKDANSVADAVVVLKTPKLDGTTLTFTVDVLEGTLPEATNAEGPAAVFIDIIGLPRTPLSYAGVARRTAYRGAWYGAAAAGAAVATGVAVGAAAAAPYYAPPPPCGYYPYPPCY